MINANNPYLKSWLKVSSNSDFPVQNIPFGVFKTIDKGAGIATRIGDNVIDLTALSDLNYLNEFDKKVHSTFSRHRLNDFIGLGKEITSKIRNRIAEIFHIDNDELKSNSIDREIIIIPITEVEMLMPLEVGDYTDFYSSKEHAINVGTMFRGAENALLPNWTHIPIGYHGRSSSIVVSGTKIHRPIGQTKANDKEKPIIEPSRLLDFELEMAFVTGKSTALGNRISINDTEDYIFGLVIFNDLSARDIQKWEYVPLGPFLSKSFASVISPWIVTLEALNPFRIEGPKQETEVLPYLKIDGKQNLNIELEVYIQSENGEPSRVCHSNMKYLYWNMFQQLTHQSINGCNINIGDLYASGTISGPKPENFGSMLELSWKGMKSVRLKNNEERKFIQDGDTIIMKAFGKNEQIRIGFGESVCKILPSK